MNIQYYIREIPFNFPFTISKGTKTHQPTFIVELEWKGMKGYGEAPAINYYHISVEKMAKDLENYKERISRFALTDPERFWHFLHHLIPDNDFLICALDMAAWDLFGKMIGKPLFQIWNFDTRKIPLTDYTIGIDSLDLMIQKMNQQPWPIYKVKVGYDGDLEMLSQLRSHTDSMIRVDANEGWDIKTALKKIPLLKDLGVELVEQPLKKNDLEGMSQLYESSPFPLIADEYMVKESDVEKCLGLFHGINIKLTKCGGLTPARRMIKKAKNLGLKVMLGCMNESTIGTAAMLHLAASVDFLDADGPMLLKEDLAKGLLYKNGKIEFEKISPGLSIEVLL
ncbi:MAG: dipeptide epimerase [Chitinophagaceae bacterium]